MLSDQAFIVSASSLYGQTSLPHRTTARDPAIPVGDWESDLRQACVPSVALDPLFPQRRDLHHVPDAPRDADTVVNEVLST
jgi:hypothetical protein